VAFLQADAQTQPFKRGNYELAVSRFGAMFFSQPVTAFTNLGTALAQGGRLALLTWQAPDRNEWVVDVRGALAAGRDLPGPALNFPGPFGLADPAHTYRVLQDSGFIDIDIEGVHEPLWFGADIEEALAFISDLGIARALLHDLDESSRSNALARLRDLLVDHATADGITFASSAWMVTARLTDSRSR
jgi:SAM-dependent methyltransferase